MISKMLADTRKQRNLTMKEVAEAIGMKPDTYRNYESGRLEPNLATLSKLADFYHVSTDYLLGRNTEEQSALDELAGQFNMSLLEKKIVEEYLALPDAMRGDLMDFLRRAVCEVEEESSK